MWCSDALYICFSLNLRFEVTNDDPNIWHFMSGGLLPVLHQVLMHFFFLMTSGKLESLRFITRQLDTYHCFTMFHVLEVKAENGQDLCSILNKKFLWIALSLVWLDLQYSTRCLLGVMDPVHELPLTFLALCHRACLAPGSGWLCNGHHHKATAAAIATTDRRIPICDANWQGKSAKSVHSWD